MKAITYSRRGSSEVLHLTDLADPRPGPGEVRVRVRVSGVNPTDWKQRVDSRPLDVPFQIPNQDGAGVIDEVGAGVDSGRVGRRVWIYFAAWFRAGGTAAEFVVVPQEQAVPLPDSASMELGASLGIPALTAHRLLFADGPLDTSRPILVTAGAGAVGHMAIQLAKHRGATVITTVSSEQKAAIAATAGPDVILNYREEDLVDAIRSSAPGRVSRIVDVAPGTNANVNAAVLTPGGTIATYANDAPLPVLPHMRTNAVVRFVLVYTMGAMALRAAIEGVAESVERGLVTLPLHRFPLSRTADVHDPVQQGAIGKVVIDVHEG